MKNTASEHGFLLESLKEFVGGGARGKEMRRKFNLVKMSQRKNIFSLLPIIYYDIFLRETR